VRLAPVLSTADSPGPATRRGNRRQLSSNNKAFHRALPDLHERPKRPEWYTWPAHSIQHGCTATVIEHWRDWPPERVQVGPQDQVPALAGCLDTSDPLRHVCSVLSDAVCPQAARCHPRPRIGAACADKKEGALLRV
jgi:hypothetical protein